MPATRRALLKVLSGTAVLAAMPALGSGNDGRLACKLLIDGVVHYDSLFRITAQLEAKERSCVYYPLSWGYVWGLRLYLSDAEGKVSEPQFHMNFDHPGPGSMARSENYRCLEPGEVANLTDYVAASSIFPARGRFSLQVGYVPEPVRGSTPVPNTVVMEDGSILSPWYPVNVT